MEVGSVAAQIECADQMSRRTTNKRRPIPPRRWIRASRVQRVSRTRRVTAELIDLPDAIGNWFE
jgi:hypothetical protein